MSKWKTLYAEDYQNIGKSQQFQVEQPHNLIECLRDKMKNSLRNENAMIFTIGRKDKLCESMHEIYHSNNRQFKRQIRKQRRSNMRKSPRNEGAKSSDSKNPCVHFNE